MENKAEGFASQCTAATVPALLHVDGHNRAAATLVSATAVSVCIQHAALSTNPQAVAVSAMPIDWLCYVSNSASVC